MLVHPDHENHPNYAIDPWVTQQGRVPVSCLTVRNMNRLQLRRVASLGVLPLQQIPRLLLPSMVSILHHPLHISLELLSPQHPKARHQAMRRLSFLTSSLSLLVSSSMLTSHARSAFTESLNSHDNFIVADGYGPER